MPHVESNVWSCRNCARGRDRGARAGEPAGTQGPVAGDRADDRDDRVRALQVAGLSRVGHRGRPHTIENSFRKAYTSRTFRVPSGEIATRLKDNPTLPFVHLSNVVAAQGALPIKVGDDIIGAVGVSGAPGGEKDEVCSKAGIDKVADQLK